MKKLSILALSALACSNVSHAQSAPDNDQNNGEFIAILETFNYTADGEVQSTLVADTQEIPLPEDFTLFECEAMPWVVTFNDSDIGMAVVQCFENVNGQKGELLSINGCTRSPDGSKANALAEPQCLVAR